MRYSFIQSISITVVRVFLLAVPYLMGGAANAADLEEHPTGLKPLTEEHRRWMRQNMQVSKGAQLNQIGLDRVQAHLAAQGLSPAKIAPVAHGMEPTSAAAPAAAAALPVSVDNSKLKYFPPIRDQHPLGSCVCFSEAYYVMTYMTAMARNWDVTSNSDNSNKFSPRFMYNMVNGGADTGSFLCDPMYIMLNFGCPTWADFPYDNVDYRSWPTNAAVWRDALNYRMDQAGIIENVNTDAGIQTVKQFLNNGYVLSFATTIYGWQFKKSQDNPQTTADDEWVGKDVAVEDMASFGNHCMTIVGYNDSVWVDLNGNGQIDPGELGAFKIANSWGSNWGDSGFTYIAYDAFKEISAVSGGPADYHRRGICIYGEVYWITARPSYSPSQVAQFTLNTAKRDHVMESLGISSTNTTSPAVRLFPGVLGPLAYTGNTHNGCGGPYAFDGSTTPCDCTFVLDASDLNPSIGAQRRFYLCTNDIYLNGDAPCTIKDFRLIDIANGNATAVASGLPKTADQSEDLTWIDYTVPAGNQAPIARISTSSTTGGEPLTVSFDGSASSDPDGSIVSYFWNFGDGGGGYGHSDGGNASGVTASHTYLRVGSFTATLTVTDNAGAKTTVSVPITVTGTKAEAVFIKTDTTTQGNWKGVYGSEGYNIIGDSVSYPSSLQLATRNQSLVTWASSTTDSRGLMKAGSTDHVAAAWSNGYEYLVDFNFTDANWHTVAIYCVDWQNAGRLEMLTFAEGPFCAGNDLSGQFLNSAPFSTGSYLVWNVKGHVTLRVDDGSESGLPNLDAVISGIFIGTGAPNYPPVITSPALAAPNPATVGQSVTFTVAASDPENDPLTYVWNFGDGASGSSSAASHAYGAPGAYNAMVTVSDGKGGTVTSSVAVSVTAAGNHAPVAQDQSVSTPMNTPLDITLVATDADGDPLTYSINYPYQTTLSGNHVTFTPSPGFTGLTWIRFKANDGKVDSNLATVIINVTAGGANHPPVAQDQYNLVTPQDTPLAITLVATDADGDPLTYSVTYPYSSTLNGNKLVFTPSPGFTGLTWIRFKANDGKVDSNLATVVINVIPRNPPAGSDGSSSSVTAQSDSPVADSSTSDSSIDLGSIPIKKLCKVKLPIPANAPPKAKISMSGLPKGLHLSGGKIVGHPVKSETFALTAKFTAKLVSLTAGKRTTTVVQASQNYTLTVTP